MNGTAWRVGEGLFLTQHTGQEARTWTHARRCPRRIHGGGTHRSRSRTSGDQRISGNVSNSQVQDVGCGVQLDEVFRGLVAAYEGGKVTMVSGVG